MTTSEASQTTPVRRKWWVVGVLVGLFAVAGVWASVAPSDPPSSAEQVRAVAQTLRCPTCIGEDVADSASPIAEAMRLVVAEQVAEGRSVEEIQAWFAQRYGDDVLLDPPRRGAGWVLWLLPLAVLAVGATVLARRHVRGGVRRVLTVGLPIAVVAGLGAMWAAPDGEGRAITQNGPGGGPPTGSEVAAHTSPTPVLADAVAESPGNLSLRVALARSLEHEGQMDAAAHAYAAAVRLSPMDADLRYRQAFTLIRADQQAGAEEVLTEALQVDPDHPPSLLLLGTIRQEGGDQDGRHLLRQFLQVAPQHPMADRVRDWLGESEAVAATTGGGG